MSTATADALTATEPSIRVDGVEIDRAAFLSRDDFDAMLADGRLVVPATASISASMISLWRAGELAI